jgi:hypothetical protein
MVQWAPEQPSTSVSWHDGLSLASSLSKFARSENLRCAVKGDFLQDPVIGVTLESQVGSPFSRPVIGGG